MTKADQGCAPVGPRSLTPLSPRPGHLDVSWHNLWGPWGDWVLFCGPHSTLAGQPQTRCSPGPRMAVPSLLPSPLWAPSLREPLGRSTLKAEDRRGRGSLLALGRTRRAGELPLGGAWWGSSPPPPASPPLLPRPQGPHPSPAPCREAPGGGAPPGPATVPAAHTHGDSGATILSGGRSGRGLLGLH